MPTSGGGTGNAKKTKGAPTQSLSDEDDDVDEFGFGNGFDSDTGDDGGGWDEYPHVLAVHNYDGRGTTELSFREGDLMAVEERLDKHWYHGFHRSQRSRGFIPIAYVRHCANWRNVDQPGQGGAPL
jgi:hypothetical protein